MTGQRDLWDDATRLAAAVGWVRDRLRRAAGERVAETGPPPADPPPLTALSGRLGLSRFERDVLLLCAAAEFDMRVGRLCARVQDDMARPYPTFALALTLFENPDWAALAPDAPLRAWRLVELYQPSATPLLAAALRLDERVIHYFKGLNRLDDRLAGLVAAADPVGRALPPSQAAAATTVARAWQVAAAGAGPWPVVQLVGPDSVSRVMVGGHAACAVGMQPYRVAADQLPGTPAEATAVARLWERESRLLSLALVVEVGDDAPGDAPPIAAARFVAHLGAPVVISAREPVPITDRPSVVVDVAKPTAHEQRAAWLAALGPQADEAARRLAGQFNLNLPAIHLIGRLAQPAAEPEVVAAAAWDGCRAAARPRAAGLARRIDARATWADLVLPAAAERALRQIASQIRHRPTVYGDWGFGRVMTRGLGITALFAGASGTGKTMAAEVLANDLRLDLFRIDLSAVVSKYIGETEKNLRRVFDAFEDSGAVLLFDEADALFGKRTEVRDSHDRYANIEVNYLLQRLESYRGLAILATNAREVLDQAFLRRLRFVITFPVPGTAERRRLWAGAFPRQADGFGGVPTAGLDLTRLAGLDLTGGTIHSAALGASFRAAAAGTAVTMAEVMAAARDEYEKADRPILEAEFRWEPEGGRV